MQQRAILLIDDDPVNLQVLEEYLKLGKNSDHAILKCNNGKEGLGLLHEHYGNIDVILLDRMMPIMSGVGFLQEFNKVEEYRKIPVIMQTASDQSAHIQEGFQLGVYHYLIKPLSPSLFNSIVYAAIELYTTQRKLQNDLNISQRLFQYVDHAAFQIKTLEDVKIMSVSLATLFPDPHKVVTGISEILINAIEHGNLGISYDEKTRLNLQMKWEEEIQNRLNHPDYAKKVVKITFEKSTEALFLTIKDEGAGFNFKKYLNFDPRRSTDNHGRGIAFANSLSFDSLEYRGEGNEVVCSIKLM